MYRGPRGPRRGNGFRGGFGSSNQSFNRPREPFDREGSRPFLLRGGTRGSTSRVTTRQPFNPRQPWLRDHWQEQPDRDHPSVPQSTTFQSQVEDEVEPTLKDSEVTLDWYNSDLNLIISKENSCSAYPMHSGGFGHVWAGARATHGVKRGRVCFEVRIDDLCPINIDVHPSEATHVLRVGWSLDTSSMQLGEERYSYGYGGTGKISHDSKFFDYGGAFGKQGDVIGCFIDLTVDPIQVSFSVNGNDRGVAFLIDKADLRDRPLFPHVLSKNVAFSINFGQLNIPWATMKVNHVPMIRMEDLQRGTKPPADRKSCQFLMMVGLPGAGKTFWADRYRQYNSDARFNVLGTNALIDRMKVMGLPRRRNYHGRWEALIEQCSECFQKLVEIAATRKRNFIVDQTNVYPTARVRKLKPFAGFTRKLIVVVPPDPEFQRRVLLREQTEGKDVPEEAVLGMKANFVLPDIEEIQHTDEILYTELGPEEATMLVTQYNAEANAKGHNTSVAVKAYMSRCAQVRRDRNDHRPLGRQVSNRELGSVNKAHFGERDASIFSTNIESHPPSAGSHAETETFDDSRRKRQRSVNSTESFGSTQTMGGQQTLREHSRSPKRIRPSAVITPWITSGQPEVQRSQDEGQSWEGAGSSRLVEKQPEWEPRNARQQTSEGREEQRRVDLGQQQGSSMQGQRRHEEQREFLAERSSGFGNQRGGYEPTRGNYGRHHRGNFERESAFGHQRGGLAEKGVSGEQSGYRQTRGEFEQHQRGFGQHRRGFEQRGGFRPQRGGFTQEREYPDQESHLEDRQSAYDEQGSFDEHSRFESQRGFDQSRRDGPPEQRGSFHQRGRGFRGREGYNRGFSRGTFRQETPRSYPHEQDVSPQRPQYRETSFEREEFERGFERGRFEAVSSSRSDSMRGQSFADMSNQRYPMHPPSTSSSSSSANLSRDSSGNTVRSQFESRGSYRPGASSLVADYGRDEKDEEANYPDFSASSQYYFPDNDGSRNGSAPMRREENRNLSRSDTSSSFSSTVRGRGWSSSTPRGSRATDPWAGPPSSGASSHHNNRNVNNPTEQSSWTSGAANAPGSGATSERSAATEGAGSRGDGVMDYKGLLQYLQFYQKQMGGNGGQERK